MNKVHRAKLALPVLPVRKVKLALWVPLVRLVNKVHRAKPERPVRKVKPVLLVHRAKLVPPA